MRTSFVRALWGQFTGPDVKKGDDGTITGATNPRPSKMMTDILRNTKEKLGDKLFPFVVYTFGKINHEFLLKMGFESILVNDKPQLWDMKTELYRHKLEVFKLAMKDFDEIVFLDWDCVLTRPLSDDFWVKLRRKDIFQANLFQYRTKKCLWRDKDPRKVTNGGFVYLRDKSAPDKMIQNWETFKQWSEGKIKERCDRGLDLRFREKCLTFDDEPAMSKFVDDYSGGWKGADYYFEHFEPDVCVLRKKSVYNENVNRSKGAYFMHML